MSAATSAAAMDDFRNRLRIMLGIDMHELEAAGVILHGDRNAWVIFSQDPFRFFIRANDATAEKIWSVIERRAARLPPHG
ncbi:hypothetical protein [Ancylobacter radicis]|uniref:Uncharacterized protein n=1 Tax=Ancylobacter radicis TaxID=2836179 RepID=A0ABS5R3D7_9HYPH|nr:hypothetical protein [Ancylobacter radicis]MBS9476181.1 hypothetical protein [Ancylobacter radicis]